MSDKFLFFTDIHIHPHAGNWSRVQDGLKVLDWVKEEALKRNIQTVIFGGDFFHLRERILALVFNQAFRKLKEMKDAGLNIIMLVGNHDMPLKYSTQYNNISVLSSVATIVDDAYVIHGNEYDFHLLPYVEDVDQLQWAIEQSEQRKDPDKKNCLIAHLDIKGAWYNSVSKAQHGAEAENLSERWDLVLSGHFHKLQYLGKNQNVLYLGTPYEQDFGDVGQHKGILVFEDGKLDFIENTFTSKHVIVEPSEIDERVRNNFVRLVIKDPTQDMITLRMKLEQYSPRFVEVVETAAAFENEEISQVFETTRDIDKLITEWVNKNAPVQLDKVRLLTMGQAIIQSVQE